MTTGVVASMLILDFKVNTGIMHFLLEQCIMRIRRRVAMMGRKFLGRVLRDSVFCGIAAFCEFMRFVTCSC